MILELTLLRQSATLPARGSPLAVGYDLSADLEYGSLTIWRRRRCTVPTGVAVAIPEGYYGRVAPRSGLAAKHGIDVLAGVIDPDYRGEIFVILMNNGDDDVTIAHGQRIAQLIIEACATPEVRLVMALPETARGAGGLGSTG